MKLPPENPLEEERIVEEEVSHSAGNLMESKTSHLDDILNEKLTRAFHKETFQIVLHDIVKIACEHSPIDLAYAACRLPANERSVLYENLPDLDAKTEFMVNTDGNTRLAVFRRINDTEAKKLVENMSPDDAVFILEDIPEKRFRRIVDMLEPKMANRIKEIKKHLRNTAGRLMTNAFFSFTMERTIGEAARYIHNNPGIDLTDKIFVTNKEELQGYVPARNLIVNPPHLPLKQVMRPVLHKVNPEATREEVIDLVERYKISALPVVDLEDKLLGVITYEEVLEAVEDVADETIANMAGTAEKVSEHDPTYKRFIARSPWLVVTLCAGLINVSVMSSIQSYEGGLLTFALFFVPLITGMSGNIGIQTSTVLVRSMATGMLSVGSKGQAVLKELLIGFLCAVVFGVLCGLSIYALDFAEATHLSLTSLGIGLIVGIGLFGACLTGSILGVISPLFFARLGVDPAIAAGPIITAINDFLSMSIFFLITIGLTALLV